MKRWLIVVAFLLTFLWCPRAQAQCSATNVGNGWTCELGWAWYSMGFTSYTESPSGASIAVGDLMLVCVDSDTTNLTVNFTVSDNADSESWAQYPPGIQSQSIDEPSDKNPWTCLYHVATVAKSSGYSFTIGSVGSVLNINDFGWSQYRYSSGTTMGLENGLTPGGCTTSGCSIEYTSDAFSATGTCPCIFTNQSITTQYGGDLIIAVMNENSGVNTIQSGWTAVDQSASNSGAACNIGIYDSSTSTYPGCWFAVNTQSGAGSISYEWTDPVANDPGLAALMAFRNSSAGIVPGSYINGNSLIKGSSVVGPGAEINLAVNQGYDLVVEERRRA